METCSTQYDQKALPTSHMHEDGHFFFCLLVDALAGTGLGLGLVLVPGRLRFSLVASSSRACFYTCEDMSLDLLFQSTDTHQSCISSGKEQHFIRPNIPRTSVPIVRIEFLSGRVLIGLSLCESLHVPGDGFCLSIQGIIASLGMQREVSIPACDQTCEQISLA